MSSNKMFREAKAKLFTKKTKRNQNTNHLFSQETGRIESILHGTAFGNMEKLVEFIWFLLCFHFARRGREGWWELTRQSFDFC